MTTACLRHRLAYMVSGYRADCRRRAMGRRTLDQIISSEATCFYTLCWTADQCRHRRGEPWLDQLVCQERTFVEIWSSASTSQESHRVGPTITSEASSNIIFVFVCGCSLCAKSWSCWARPTCWWGGRSKSWRGFGAAHGWHGYATSW